jgi:hypothetical protein
LLLDDAATSGCQSWMFLGGNPDQSVLGILEAFRQSFGTYPFLVFGIAKSGLL